MDTKILKTWMRRLSFRGFSIQQRLPLLICVLLLSVIITFSLISYFGLKRAALSSGKERLSSLTDQLSNMFSQTAVGFSTPIVSAASQDLVKNYLKTRDSSLIPRINDLLLKLRQDSLSVLAELLDPDNTPLLFSRRIYPEVRTDLNSFRERAVKNDSIAVGNFFQSGDTVFYPVVSPVNDQQKRIGYLLVWRKISTSRRTVEQLSKLLGSHARLYVGNRDKSMWTDFLRPVPDPYPSKPVQSENFFDYRSADGKYVIASGRPIPNTSWQVLIEFPKQNVLETANRFLKWLILIGAVLMAAGIFIAWRMSRNITSPLKKLTIALSEIASGKYRTAIAIDRRDELGKLARAFDAMTNQVSKAKKELERQVLETGNRNEQLRELSAHLQNIREEERIHIAREMHDELGQLLTGFKMDVSWLHKKLGETEDPAVREKLEEMMGIVNDAAKFVRKLASELRPSILDDLGLIPALDWHSQEFQRRSHIDVDFRATHPELKVSELIATGLFRMYQESLTNVARHADAKKVVVTLDSNEKEVSLSITDDGKGFDIQGTGARKTLGLLGMRERAAMIGGKLEIISAPGKGTTILITVPLHEIIDSPINETVNH